MERSLSVLLPVHNAQATLESHVTRLLDVVPELTWDFDLLIIDDGSTDATVEVAHELATRYTQVYFIRHSRPEGLKGALRTGLANTRGEFLFVHDGSAKFEPAELSKLWKLRDSNNLVLAQCEAPSKSKPKSNRVSPWTALTRLFSGGVRGRKSCFHMLSRRALGELSLEGQAKGRQIATRRDLPAKPGAKTPSTPLPADLGAPNYITQLRDFALGE